MAQVVADAAGPRRPGGAGPLRHRPQPAARLRRRVRGLRPRRSTGAAALPVHPRGARPSRRRSCAACTTCGPRLPPTGRDPDRAAAASSTPASSAAGGSPSTGGCPAASCPAGWPCGVADERRQVLRGYLDAAAALQQLPSADHGFARLIGEDRREFDSLAELLTDQLSRAVQGASTASSRTSRTSPRCGIGCRSALVERTCEPRLVHGDYCPPNVYLSCGRRGSAGRLRRRRLQPAHPVRRPAAGHHRGGRLPRARVVPGRRRRRGLADRRGGRAVRRRTAEWIAHYRVFYGFYFSNAYAVRPAALRLVPAATRGA